MPDVDDAVISDGAAPAEGLVQRIDSANRVQVHVYWQCVWGWRSTASCPTCHHDHYCYFFAQSTMLPTATYKAVTGALDKIITQLAHLEPVYETPLPILCTCIQRDNTTSKRHALCVLPQPLLHSYTEP